MTRMRRPVGRLCRQQRGSKRGEWAGRDDLRYLVLGSSLGDDEVAGRVAAEVDLDDLVLDQGNLWGGTARVLTQETRREGQREGRTLLIALIPTSRSAETGAVAIGRLARRKRAFMVRTAKKDGVD